LTTAAADDRRTLLQAYLREVVAHILALEPGALVLDKPLQHLGVDSLMATQLRNSIYADLGLEVPMVAFMSDTSLTELTAHLHELLHVNHVALGQRSVDPPELPPHRQTHFTLEPSYGLTSFWELGGYFQTTLRGDGHFDYSGVKLRSKFVARPSAHVRLGVNFELSILPDTYDRDRWGTEVRPIAAYEDSTWMFAVNPIVDTSLAGPGFSDGPSFEPAALAMLKAQEKFGFGLEYYANLGPFANPLPLKEQEHYVYEVEYLLFVRDVELQIGIGEGLTPGSNPLVAKMIAGYVF